MRTYRLIGILSILLQKDVVTAKYFADEFEVSVRTIHRDIEELCKAGIPIITRQGNNGGISIMDNYKFDRTLLTNKEMQDILTGLKTLDSFNNTNRYQQLMDKLSIDNSNYLKNNDYILIDLNSWDNNDLPDKINLVRHAIEEGKLLDFTYLNQNGETIRSIEPYYLIFHWSCWYVYGYCTKRHDYRLFKLNRMVGISIGNNFNKREVSLPIFDNKEVFNGDIEVVAMFDKDCKWRLVEEFGINSFQEMDDHLLFTNNFKDENSILSWLLTFQDKVKIIKPDSMKNKYLNIINRMKDLNYDI